VSCDGGSERVEGRWTTIFERIEAEKDVEGYKETVDLKDFCLCVRACVRACVYVSVTVCMCVREREKERNRDERAREEYNDAKRAFKNRLDSGRGLEETASTCISVKAQLGRVCHDR
jgi:hypothetical protein